MNGDLLCSLDNGWHYDKSQSSTSKSCCIADHMNYWLNGTKQQHQLRTFMKLRVNETCRISSYAFATTPKFSVLKSYTQNTQMALARRKQLQSAGKWHSWTQSTGRGRAHVCVAMWWRFWGQITQPNLMHLIQACLSGATLRIPTAQDKGDLTVFG